jgi:hypothetical protein
MPSHPQPPSYAAPAQPAGQPSGGSGADGAARPAGGFEGQGLPAGVDGVGSSSTSGFGVPVPGEAGGTGALPPLVGCGMRSVPSTGTLSSLLSSNLALKREETGESQMGPVTPASAEHGAALGGALAAAAQAQTHMPGHPAQQHLPLPHMQLYSPHGVLQHLPPQPQHMAGPLPGFPQPLGYAPAYPGVMAPHGLPAMPYDDGATHTHTHIHTHMMAPHGLPAMPYGMPGGPLAGLPGGGLGMPGAAHAMHTAAVAAAAAAMAAAAYGPPVGCSGGSLAAAAPHHPVAVFAAGASAVGPWLSGQRRNEASLACAVCPPRSRASWAVRRACAACPCPPCTRRRRHKSRPSRPPSKGPCRSGPCTRREFPNADAFRATRLPPSVPAVAAPCTQCL